MGIEQFLLSQQPIRHTRRFMSPGETGGSGGPGGTSKQDKKNGNHPPQPGPLGSIQPDDQPKPIGPFKQPGEGKTPKGTGNGKEPDEEGPKR